LLYTYSYIYAYIYIYIHLCVYIELDGRPALLFVTIHTIEGQKVQQVGRTAVLIQGEVEFLKMSVCA